MMRNIRIESESNVNRNICIMNNDAYQFCWLGSDGEMYLLLKKIFVDLLEVQNILITATNVVAKHQLCQFYPIN